MNGGVLVEAEVVLGGRRSGHPWTPCRLAPVDHGPPRSDECPEGGGHAPIPKQDGAGRVCAKCGGEC
ncbi:hypothetical protein [Saccharopolyspora rosea]|uniref:Uncharacterized protein n=1 Tax=Saccharopolyspora rosea TaxID=524884 RepID=A0ABW3G3A8_9PSEU|nr:hypothetical protein [Saccharopolyspora rosea]